MTNQQAIEILNNELDDNIWAKPEFELREAINTAIKALEQTRWVPVSERLPKESGYYLGYSKYGERFVIYFDLEADNYYQPKWSDPGEVVAWMPLPEAWEGE